MLVLALYEAWKMLFVSASGTRSSLVIEKMTCWACTDGTTNVTGVHLQIVCVIQSMLVMMSFLCMIEKLPKCMISKQRPVVHSTEQISYYITSFMAQLVAIHKTAS